MEQNFQTSFIPKKPIIRESSVSVRPVSFFLIISIFVLVAVLLITVGLYFYKGIVAKNITSMQSQLSLAESSFEPSKITELQLLDKRLNAATDILSKHVAVSPVFQALESITMKSVRYTQFTYTFSNDKNTVVDIKMSGIAQGYKAIALQSDLFNQSKNIINPVFSNLTLDNSGNVLFDLDFSVDPNFINYKQNLLTQS